MSDSDQEWEHISQEDAQNSLDEYDAPPGVVEAIELYESAMVGYSSATAPYAYTQVSSSSSSW